MQAAAARACVGLKPFKIRMERIFASPDAMVAVGDDDDDDDDDDSDDVRNSLASDVKSPHAPPPCHHTHRLIHRSPWLPGMPLPSNHASMGGWGASSCPLHALRLRLMQELQAEGFTGA